MVGAALLAAPAFAQEEGDLARRLRLAYMAAADGLLAQQDASGAWSVRYPDRSAPSVAYTGLIVRSLAEAPEPLRPLYKAAVEKGARYILSRANLDGSFGEGERGAFLKTYTTAIALMALSSVERTDRTAAAIRGAQEYLKRHQLREGLHAGGLGYGDEELKRNPDTGEWEIQRNTAANLSVTAKAAEALKVSGLSDSDEFWPLAAEFARKCQNSTEVNTSPLVASAFKERSKAIGDEGGHIYTPDPDERLHRAGTRTVGGRTTFVSYGSMTYEGIKTYLYAGLDKASPEVKAAISWIRRNYSVEGHPGFAFDRRERHHLRGLFYYYVVLARALDAYGENPFVTADGVKHDWPRELAEQFLKTARESRMWQNDNPAWWEGDPVLVTSYVLTACDVLFKYLK